MGRFFLLFAGVSGFLSVVTGAFAAHGLKQMLAPEMIEVVKTGAQYQMYHALALMLVALWLKQIPPSAELKAAGLAFILGSLLFSGSLHALALGAPRWLGPITPVGGLCFLVGWMLLTMSAWRTSSTN